MSTEIESACKIVAEKILGWTYRFAGTHEIWRDGPWSSTTSTLRKLDELLTGNGMIELMGALHRKGYIVIVNNTGDAEIRGSRPEQRDSVRVFNADTTPKALALAAAELVTDHE